MPRFQSKEEYEKWRASQRGDEPAPASADGEAPAEQVYDGPAPGSREFHDHRLQQAGLATEREKNMAMLCHLAAFAGFLVPFGNIIGPVIVWMSGKADSSFVNEHGKASLNFQISLTLFFLLSAILGFFLGPLVIVLILVFGIAVIYGIIMIIVNSVKAHNGEDGEYALSNRFLS
jgi:uncharacterized protein